MTRTLFVAWLGLLAGVLPAAGHVQDPPLFIPNETWNGLGITGDAGRTEREFKFTVSGQGLNDFDNATLTNEIQQAMTAAVTTVSWQAPPLVGFCYQTTLPDNLNPVFVDIYFDTREGANYLWNTSYRLRMRFQNSADIPGLRPLRVEYQSHFDQTPFVDGFSARTESRINLGPQPIATASNLDRFIQNAQSGMVDSSVMAPSRGLVDFYRRKTQEAPRLFYVSNLVLETDRGRSHFTVDLTNLRIGQGVEEVFLITMDTFRVYLAADYLRWLRKEDAVKPNPLTILSEVEVEFERGAQVPLERAIDQARSGGDTARVDQLTWIVNAFLADQRTVLETISATFAEISRQKGDANYLVLYPGVKSKYRQAYEAVFFIRGDADFSGQVDISDAIRLIEFLFLKVSVEGTRGCDVNDDGSLDVSDPIYLLSFLFLRDGLPPPQPFPYWGVDPTPG